MTSEDRYTAVRDDLAKSPRTWLVTGAAGFIGSNLVEELLRLGQRVIGLDNFSTGHRSNLEDVRRAVGEEPYHFIEGDITDTACCSRACSGVDIVLHQAALGSVPRSIDNPLATHQANVDGFVNMLNAARGSSVKRFVFASSSSVYGDSLQLPKKEGHEGQPLSPYALTKRINEEYAEIFHRSYGIQTVGLRYFNVFGPRQDPDGAYAAVIPRWIGRLLHGERCELYGDGTTSRDFCYVANVVEANLLAAAAATEGAPVYNIACGQRVTLDELYQQISEEVSAVLGRRVGDDIERRAFRAGDVRHSHADIFRARTELGYRVLVDWRRGLRDTVRWFAERV